MAMLVKKYFIINYYYINYIPLLAIILHDYLIIFGYLYVLNWSVSNSSVEQKPKVN